MTLTFNRDRFAGAVSYETFEAEGFRVNNDVDSDAVRAFFVLAPTYRDQLQVNFIDGSRNGRNSWNRLGYGGPCPPRGTTHRYAFKLYALDSVLGLPTGATKAQLLQAMQGRILAQADLMGRYAR